MTTATWWTGDNLRLLRLSRRVSASRLAAYYGATRQRISNLEKESIPSRKSASRYLEALDRATDE